MCKLILLFFFVAASLKAQVSEEWKRSYSGMGSDNDAGVFVTADNSGNSYCFGAFSSNNFFKIFKHDTNGNLIWSKEISFVLTSMKIDNEGYLVNIGYYEGDINVSKWDSSGNVIWTRSTNTPNQYEYSSRNIYIDKENNILFTGGITEAINPNYDILTFKYSSNGTLLFSRRFNGSANLNDNGNSVISDDSGNVYVAGTANINNFTSSDFVIIKYGPTGNTLWGRYFSYYSSEADFLDLDDEGNLIVTGVTYTGSSEYIITFKYTPTGTLIWQRTYTNLPNSYEEPRGMTTDRNNIFIIGYSFTKTIIIKYNENGDLQNILDYDSLYSSIFNFDNDGNILLSGIKNRSIIIAKYTPSGVLIFDSAYDPGQPFFYLRDIGISNYDNKIYITGYTNNDIQGTNEDCTIYQFDNSGNYDWQKTYAGNYYSSDIATTLILNNNETFYLFGSESYGYDHTFVTLKYKSDGSLIWERELPVDSSNSSYLIASALDVNGNVFATGYKEAGAANTDILTVKYDSSGAEQWVRSFNGPANGQDKSACIACDINGNVYVSGTIVNTPGGIDWITIKYDQSGNQLWTASYNGSASGSDNALDIAIDNQNNVYVVGKAIELSSGTDAVVIKYDGQGNQLWKKNISSAGNHNDAFRKIKTDSQDNIYLCGEIYTEGSLYDYLLVKLNGNGDVIWQRNYNGPNNLSDNAKVLDIRDDKIYVSGESFKLGSSYDIMTIEYDSSGNVIWSGRYSGASNLNDRPTAIASDEEGSVYVTGETSVTAANIDFVTIKYDKIGNEQWTIFYGNPANKIDSPVGISVSGPDQVYVSGRTFLTDNFSDILVIKYSNTIGINEPLSSVIPEFKLYDNYPNPFNPSTKIKFDISYDAYAELKIYDIAGKEVEVLLNSKISSGRHVYEWNAGKYSSGIYFYKLTVNISGKETVQSKSMILLK